MILGYDGDVICLLVCEDVSENEKSHCKTGDQGREKHMMRWRRAKDRSKMKSVCERESETKQPRLWRMHNTKT